VSIYTNLEQSIRNVGLVANNEYPDMLLNFSHQNGNEPVTSYVSINTLEMVQQGRAATPALTNLSSKLDIRTAYEVVVQFSFFGTLAGDAAHSFFNRINNNPQVFEAMGVNNLGYMRKTNLRRNPQKRDTQWVDSFNFDLTFNYIINTDQLVETVDTVILEDGYSGDVFTVPPDAVIT
jgi:hypothetical protein